MDGSMDDSIIDMEASNNVASMEGLMDDSDEVAFVLDSLAGDTFVLDSLPDDGELNSEDQHAADALMDLLASKVSNFVSDRDVQYISKLMYPVMFPHWYGNHDKDTNDAATDLLYISHGIGARRSQSSGVPSHPVEDEEFECHAFKDLKISMWKISYPSMYANK